MTDNTPIKTILILAANPKTTSRLRLDEEIREIDDGLKHSDQFKLEQKWAVRQRDFYRAILKHKPQIIHFCGHGEGDDGIVLEDEIGQSVKMGTEALSRLFKLFAVTGVECVVLNACYSEVQAEAISQYIKYVVGMNKAVGDKAAINFAVAFYDGLAAGKDVKFSYELGCSQLVDLKEDSTPVLKITEINPADIQFVAGDIPPNPYLGLSAFAEKDAEFFFGREKFTSELFDMTHQQNLVAVIGASGSGKSSVVFAGLLPKLRDEGTWLIESLRPKGQPFDELALALVRQLEPNLDGVDKTIKVGKLAKSLNKGEVKLHQVASQILENKPNKRFLLVVDQFEELYTQCQDKEQQQSFIDTLLLAVNQKSITLVFTLRADFYGYVLSYRPFSDALQEITFKPLGLMSRDELKTAIEKPSNKLGVQLQTHLAERILNDVGQEPGNLPLLEFALTQLWDKQDNNELTHQAYDEIGGVKQALVKHTEEVYKELSETKKQQAQRIFLSLVRLGETTEDTRRVATREEIGNSNWDLVRYLAGSETRLVVTGRENKSGEETVEVVHEALIREWGTLRKWVNENREKLIQKRKIEMAAIEWREKNKFRGYLLQGRQLQDVRVFQKQQDINLALSDLASEFIKTSNKQQRVRLFQISSVLTIPILIALGIIVPYQRQQSYNQAWEIIRSRQQGTRAALELLTEGCWAAEKNIPNLSLFFGKCHQFIGTDLQNANLQNANLQGANLQDANLQNTNLQRAYLIDTDLLGAELQNANLHNANLQNTNLQRAYLIDTDLQRAKLQNAKLQNANLQGANLRDANLQRANLLGAELQNTNLQRADLQNAYLQKAELQNAYLADANLQGAYLIDTYLQGANLQGANLQGAYFINAKLNNSLYDKKTKFPRNFNPSRRKMYLIAPGVSLQGANLEGANIYNVNLEGADLQNANLQNAYLQHAYLERADLERADLERAYLERADLERANLQHANLQGANLQFTNLEGAKLQFTHLEGAKLQNAYLGDANLEGAKLQNAYLGDANLEGAKLQNADLKRAKLNGANLRGARFWDKKSDSKARNITPSQIKQAKNWETAIYSPGFRKKLGLPPEKPSD